MKKDIKTLFKEIDELENKLYNLLNCSYTHVTLDRSFINEYWTVDVDSICMLHDNEVEYDFHHLTNGENSEFF